MFEIAVGGGRGPGIDRGGGAGLATGHAIVIIVYTNNIHIFISACCMDEMVAAYSEQVTITAKNRYDQFRVGKF
jgi:hypothetical protein